MPWDYVCYLETIDFFHIHEKKKKVSDMKKMNVFVYL